MTIATRLTHAPLPLGKVLPLISGFIEAGGTYQEVVDSSDGEPISGVRATYGSKSVLLAYPNIGTADVVILIPNNLDTGFTWETFLPDPGRLDACLCYWLSVPEN